jgi:CubicO group peptidase (beta-lactamase class C family)
MHKITIASATPFVNLNHIRTMQFRHSLTLSLLTLSLGLLSAFPARSTPVLEKARSLYPELRPALDDRVKGMMQRGNIPGMAVVVIKDGLVLEMKGYGVADRATQNSIGPNTKFGIGSITKPFTAMAIMLLVEDGKVDLDQPIRQYIPDVPTEWAPLTIRQLISHTAGISEDYPSWRVKQSRDLLKLGNPKLDFPPGEAWSYSNTGFRLAGLVIEQVSGQSYTDFMRDRIFTPLNMNQTQAKMAPVPNLATGYRWQRRQYAVVPVKYDRSYASGNIISTAADMTKWVQAVMSNFGQPRHSKMAAALAMDSVGRSVILRGILTRNIVAIRQDTQPDYYAIPTIG